MSRTTVHIRASAEAARSIGAWVRSAGAAATQSEKGADVVVIADPAALPQFRSQQLTVALVDDRQQWASPLRSSAVDAIIPVDDKARSQQPSIPFDVGSQETPLDEILDRVRAKPRVGVGTSVRFRHRAELWGDTHFARDLSDALRRLGWRTEVQTHRSLARSQNSANDVLLYLRGLRPCPAVATPAVLWVISHPDMVTADEVAGYQAAFAAGKGAAEALGATELLQATDPHRFFPDPIDNSLKNTALFVGSAARGRQRRSVEHALEAGLPVGLIGPGWKRSHKTLVVADRVANTELHRYYSAAGIVLNDHWADMAEYAMPSNRLFDAVASGAAVLSDAVEGADELFGSAVRTFSTSDEFRDLALEMLERAPSHELRQQWRQRVVSQHTFDHRAQIVDGTLRPLC